MLTRVIRGPNFRAMSSPTAQMDGPGLGVIEPKLMPPRVHPGVLRRARLLEMLADDAAASFTVLNAAVGYGKTTLVRSWCVERPEAVISVTLDSADDDPVRLWAHLATAVERLGEGFGRRALSCLAVRGATVETAVDELMNGLVAVWASGHDRARRPARGPQRGFGTLDRPGDRTAACECTAGGLHALGPGDRPRAPAGAPGAHGGPRPRAGFHGRRNA